MTHRIPITTRQGKARLALLSCLTVLALVALAGSVSAASVGAASVRIGEVSDRYQFMPSTTFVSIGGTVTWANGSDATHTVASDTGSELKSSQIAAGASFRHTFSAAGTFAYHCTIHPYMHGTVVVLAAGATPPPTTTAPTGPTSGGGSTGWLAVVLAAAAVAVGYALLRLRLAR